MEPRVDEKYHDEIDAARKELEKHARSKNSNARELLRLAYASQFTIAKHNEAKSTTTTTDAIEQSANNKHPQIIEEIHNKHSTITYPDLYQLAGVVAVKALGGPDIKFIPGREDSLTAPDESCLPDLKRSPEEFKKFFHKVKIFEPKHIVALYGGLKLAKDESADLKFDNKYFSHVDDKALVDKEFSEYVECYAKKNDDFIEEYKDAHRKLSEFGFPPQEATKFKKVITSPVGVGVAVAAAVVIFCVFYLINKRRTQHRSQQFQ